MVFRLWIVLSSTSELRATKKTVLGKLYGAMDTDGDKRARNALDMIQSSEAKRETIKDQLETCASQIKQYEARKGQLDDILRDNQTTSTLQKKKEDLERRILTERSSLENTIGLFFKEFSKGLFADVCSTTSRSCK